MPDSSKAPETGTNEIDENKESIAVPKRAGMSSTTKLIALAVVIVLLVAVPIGYILTQNADDETPEGTTVLTVTKDQSSVNLTMEELKDMTTTTASGGFKKTTGTIEGPFELTGIPLADFVDLLYSGTDYSLEVVATDGYTMAYSSGQVEDGTFAYYDPEDGSLLGEGDFTMIVAYAQDGLPLEDMDLRIAIVDESAPITDGHFWAKYVAELTILPFVKDWTLNLSGVMELAMDRQTFESIASCEYHAASYTYENETGTHVYTGVALWTLVSAVDGADGPATDYMFNDLLARAGYNVTVSATDGYSKSFTSEQVARNDTMIVANKLDGETLSEDDGEFPLKLVGDGLTSGQKIKSIKNISIVDTHEVPQWTLNLTGLTNAVISAETYVATYYSGLHAKNFTYTNYGGVHAAYYNYTDSEEVAHTYAGLPLWLLVAVMDGMDESHYELNSTLAAEGYDIVLTASDGYSVTIASATTAFNDTLVLAFMLDWEMLTDMAPLRLVNEFLPGSMKISNVVDIDLENLPV
ncbi:MAG: molybdopterin-dependent oxidoreductase [Thermoplasmata archaeon]|nr:molybdopterin-dependent oxidoreductase [Thermoplasmata archaeon]TFG70916.1 MAG: hypothetical protein E4H25_00650 [Methanomassiliicoccus sp.]